MNPIQGRLAGSDAVESTGMHRILPGALGALPPAERPATGRHDAITRRFGTFADYKQWAEKTRSDWVPSKDSKA